MGELIYDKVLKTIFNCLQVISTRMSIYLPQIQHDTMKSSSCHPFEPALLVSLLTECHHYTLTGILEASSAPFSPEPYYNQSTTKSCPPYFQHKLNSPTSFQLHVFPLGLVLTISLAVVASSPSCFHLPPTSSLFTRKVVRRNAAKDKSDHGTAMPRNPSGQQ